MYTITEDEKKEHKNKTEFDKSKYGFSAVQNVLSDKKKKGLFVCDVTQKALVPMMPVV